MRFIGLGGLLCLFLFSAAPAAAQPYFDGTQGYSLDIPVDWKEIPKSVIDTRITANVKPGITNFVAGFEPAAHPVAFTAPYMLVVSNDYNGGKTIHSLSEEDLRGIVASLTGISTADIRKSAAPGAPALNSFDVAAASYTTTPPGFVLDALVKASSGVTIHDHVIGLMGRQRVIEVHCYSLDSEFAANKPTFDALAASFKLDPGQQITVSDKSFSAFGRAMSSGAMGGAIAAAIFGVPYALWVRRAKRKKANPSPP